MDRAREREGRDVAAQHLLVCAAESFPDEGGGICTQRRRRLCGRGQGEGMNGLVPRMGGVSSICARRGGGERTKHAGVREE